jgi:hypothetical protein
MKPQILPVFLNYLFLGFFVCKVTWSHFGLYIFIILLFVIFTRLYYIIYWYVLYNFWKYLFVKIAARVLGPDHIVTSLEHLGTVPGVQAWTTSALCQVFKWGHYLSWA